jgi:hypothetical protein
LRATSFEPQKSEKPHIRAEKFARCARHSMLKTIPCAENHCANSTTLLDQGPRETHREIGNLWIKR